MRFEKAVTVLLNIVLGLNKAWRVCARWQIIPVHADVVRDRNAVLLHAPSQQITKARFLCYLPRPKCAADVC